MTPKDIIEHGITVARLTAGDFDWALQRALEMHSLGGTPKRCVEQALYEVRQRAAAREKEEREREAARRAVEEAERSARYRQAQRDLEAGRPSLRANTLGLALEKAMRR